MGNNKLCLGTVQFGLQYGINNKSGKPSKVDVFQMMDVALDRGIRCFDTAAAYGDAEEILGEYFSENKGREDLRIISKLKPNLIADDEPMARKIVRKQVEASLKKLRLNVLDGYLLHTPANFYNPRILEGLVDCKEKGLINNLGVSIYEVTEAIDAAESGIVDYIQVPYNVFDQRMKKSGFFQIAKKNRVKVFARSPFLQGLMLMPADEVPGHLDIASDYLVKYDSILERYKVSRVEASFLFSYHNADIDYVVFGVDNLRQLTEDLTVANREIKFDRCQRELEDSFLNISKSIIFPSLWAKK